MLVGLNKVRVYELQSVEHEEGVKENLDFRFGVLQGVAQPQSC